jgi:hypothetical protein
MDKAFKIDRMQAVADGVDEVVVALEKKWGVDRLRRLVDDDLRERFDRQHRKFNEALFNHDLAEIEKHAAGMKKGWEMLDRAATANGAVPLAPTVWEVRMPSGKVCALVRTAAEAVAVSADGRFVEVWMLDEIGRLIEGPWRDIGKVKEAFPGAIVSDLRQKELFDDEIPF